MANVLFIIHIPYEKNCSINVKILKKKRDTENEVVSNPSIKDEEETANVEDDGKEGANVDANIENPATETTEVNTEEPPAASEPDSNEFFPSAVPPIDEERKSSDTQHKEKDSISLHKISRQEKAADPAPSHKMLNRLLSYNLTEIFYRILEKNNIRRASWEFTEDGEFWQVMFQVESKNCDTLLNELLAVGIGNNEFSSISVVPVTVNFPSMLKAMSDDKEERKSSHAERKFFESVKSRLTVAQVIDSVRSGSQLTFDYIMLITMASIIAGIGLIENSSVLLVASMLVSPLMGPILGGTFGIVLNFSSLWKVGVRNEGIGLAMCVVIGFILGLLCGIIPGADSITAEMSSRCAPRSLLVGFLIAVPSGAGVALSILGGNAGSLVGVAISASLLPPAVNAGIFYAFALIGQIHHEGIPITSNSTNSTSVEVTKSSMRDYEPSNLASMGTISLLLTFLNIIVIFIMGTIILKVKEVAPNTGTAVTTNFWKKDLKTTREFLSGHMMSTNHKLSDTVLTEWGELNNMDFTNLKTLKHDKGRKLAQELKQYLEGLEIDNDYNGVRQKLHGKPQGHSLRRLASRLDPIEIQKSRFNLQKVFNVTETTLDGNKRFVISNLSEANNDYLSDSMYDLNERGTDRVNTKLPINRAAMSQALLDDVDEDRNSLV